MSWYNPVSWAKAAASKVAGVAHGLGVGDAPGDTDRPMGASHSTVLQPGTAGAAYTGPNRGGGAQPQMAGPAPAPGIAGAVGRTPTLYDQTGQAVPWQLSDKTRQSLLGQQGSLAGQFADQTQQAYANYGQQGQQALNQLQATANGQNSVSALQLSQGLQQNLAAQQSIAAGASPQNANMAARTAAMQQARFGYGLAGQQAVAGLQERNQAQQQYGGLLQGLRGQDLNAALSSRQNAETGYGAAATGAPQKSWIEQYGPSIAAGAAVLSDRRLKTDIRDGEEDADASLKGLRAHFYKYKDEKRDGAGGRVGIMAQDLERAGLKHAVVDTPRGKVVHGGHLATALAAMLPGIDKRIAKLEER